MRFTLIFQPLRSLYFFRTFQDHLLETHDRTLFAQHLMLVAQNIVIKEHFSFCRAHHDVLEC